MVESTEETEGASFSEQLIESSRRNNTELLLDIKVELKNDHEKLAQLINSTHDTLRYNTPMHLACQLGNWEFIDIVLDIEGVEIDPRNREGSTPLHLAVKYAADEPEHGGFIVDNLLDAGSDPRIKDNHNLRPIDYASKDNTKLRELLESAEYAISMEADQLEPMEEQGLNGEVDDQGSASESD